MDTFQDKGTHRRTQTLKRCLYGHISQMFKDKDGQMRDQHLHHPYIRSEALEFDSRELDSCCVYACVCVRGGEGGRVCGGR